MNYLKFLDFVSDFIKLEDKSEFIIFTRHDPCFVLGQNSDDKEILTKNHLSVYKSNRGGGATYHDLGQILIYPFINLKKRNLSISEYILILEKWIVQSLGQFGIVLFKKNNPGLFTENGKVCFIGLKVSEGYVMHGASLNLENCGVENFNHIIPCKNSSKNSSKNSCENFETISKCMLNFEDCVESLKMHNPFEINIKVLA